MESVKIEVMYGYTKNLGNYESERIEVRTTVLVPVEDKDQAIQEEYDNNKAFVREQLKLDPPKDSPPVDNSCEGMYEAPPRRRRF